MKILVIDDQASVRRFVVRVLRAMFNDAYIDVSESADSAIGLIRVATLGHPYDLVVSDFNLIGARTGGDVLEWIQDHASYLESRFLFFTSDTHTAKRHKHYVEKPCKPPVLQAAITTILDMTRNT